MEWYDWLIIAISIVIILFVCIIIITASNHNKKNKSVNLSGLKGEDILTIKNWYISQSESKFFHFAKPAAQMMNAYIFPKVQIDSIICSSNDECIYIS